MNKSFLKKMGLSQDSITALRGRKSSLLNKHGVVAIRVIDSGIIYSGQNAEAQHKFAFAPSLTLLSDSSILCSFKVGNSKLSPNDNIRIMKSKDGGRTWQEHFYTFNPVFENVSGSIHNCCIFECNRQKLIAVSCWVNRANPDLPYSNPATGGILPTKCLLTESYDGGATWGDFRQISTGQHSAACPSGKIIRLNNGNIVFCYENWKQWDQIEGNYTTAIVLSHNEGKSWSYPVTVASDLSGDLYFWDSRAARNPESGELFITLWTLQSKTGNDLNLHVVKGSSDGFDWTLPAAIEIKGQTAAPLFISDNTVFLVYVTRDGRHCIKAALSDNCGRTWYKSEEVILYRSEIESSAGQDIYGSLLGGPDTICLGDGTILVTFYVGDNSQLSIHWIKIAFSK